MSQRKTAVPKKAPKTSVAAATVLLPSDDVELYAKHLENYRVRYSPSGPAEVELVQRIADAAWCLDRIPNLENELFIRGETEFADLHRDVEGRARAMLIQAESFRAYGKEFRNLMTQEYRLQRALEKDTAALKQLQLERSKIEGLRRLAGRGHSFEAAKIGFEFIA